MVQVDIQAASSVRKGASEISVAQLYHVANELGNRDTVEEAGHDMGGR